MVIAIIAILASMLLPALKGAKDRGKSINCVSNIHQLMLANHLYAGDSDGFLVSAIASTSLYASQEYWFAKLAETGQYVTPEALICPSDTLPSYHSDYFRVRTTNKMSYGYSGFLGNYYRAHIHNWPTVKAKRIQAFKSDTGRRSDPTTAFCIFDFTNVEWSGGNWANYNVDGGTSFGITRLSARHNGGFDVRDDYQYWPTIGSGNFGFVDGHAESIRAPFSGKYSLHATFGAKYDFAGSF